MKKRDSLHGYGDRKGREVGWWGGGVHVYAPGRSTPVKKGREEWGRPRIRTDQRRPPSAASTRTQPIGQNPQIKTFSTGKNECKSDSEKETAARARGNDDPHVRDGTVREEGKGFEEKEYKETHQERTVNPVRKKKTYPAPGKTERGNKRKTK